MNGYMTRKRNQLWIEANKTEMARYERASYKNYYKFWFLVHETSVQHGDQLLQWSYWVAMKLMTHSCNLKVGLIYLSICIYICDSRKNCFNDSRKFQFEHSHMYVPFGMHMCLDHRISAMKTTGSKNESGEKKKGIVDAIKIWCKIWHICDLSSLNNIQTLFFVVAKKKNS